MDRQGEAFSGPQPCGVADAGGGFRIIAPALGLIAGKIPPVLRVLKASRIVEDFILLPLTIEVRRVMAEATKPVGGI